MGEGSGRNWRDLAWQVFKPALVAAIVALLVAMGVTGIRAPYGATTSDGGGVGVMSNTTFSGPLFVQGGVQSGNNITMGAGSLINSKGAVTVTDHLWVTRDVKVVGAMTVTTLISESNGLRSTGGGGLDVAGNITMTAGAILNADGAVTVTDSVLVSGLATLGSGLSASNNITTSAALKFGTLFGGSVPALSTYITVTTNSYITPTYTLQPLTAADAVFTANVAAGVAGRLLVLWNVGNTTITISDTGAVMLSAVWAGTQYDTLTLVSDGTNWLEIARSTN